MIDMMFIVIIANMSAKVSLRLNWMNSIGFSMKLRHKESIRVQAQEGDMPPANAFVALRRAGSLAAFNQPPIQSSGAVFLFRLQSNEMEPVPASIGKLFDF